ncbi:MAG: hypothetical protein RR311_18285 [Comamonas sp.]
MDQPSADGRKAKARLGWLQKCSYQYLLAENFNIEKSRGLSMKFNQQNLELDENSMHDPEYTNLNELLIDSIKTGDYFNAHALIEADADINTPDENGESPLIIMLKSRMAYFNNMQQGAEDEATIDRMNQIIELMFAKGAMTDVTDGKGRTVLDLIIENPSNEYLFVSAIKHKIHLPDDAIEKLIAGNVLSADIRSFRSYEMDEAIARVETAGPVSPIYPTPMAAALGNERFLELLLEKNNTADVERSFFLYDYYETSLYHAMRSYQWKCAELLIRAGHSYKYDPDTSIIDLITSEKCTNMTVVNYCVSHIADSCTDRSDNYDGLEESGFTALIDMLKDVNVDIFKQDALKKTLLQATLESGLEGSDKYELVAVLLEKFPDLIPQAIQNMATDHKALQFLFESELNQEVDYAGPLYEFIIEKNIVLDFDSVELLEGALDACAASLLCADANNLM